MKKLIILLLLVSCKKQQPESIFLISEQCAKEVVGDNIVQEVCCSSRILDTQIDVNTHKITLICQ